MFNKPLRNRYRINTDRYVRYSCTHTCPDLYADASGGLGPRAPLRFLFFVSSPPPAPSGRLGRPLTENSISHRPAHRLIVCRAASIYLAAS